MSTMEVATNLFTLCSLPMFIHLGKLAPMRGSFTAWHPPYLIAVDHIVDLFIPMTLLLVF